jgi:hypothetical protein
VRWRWRSAPAAVLHDRTLRGPPTESGRFAVEKRHLRLLEVRPAFMTYSARDAGTVVMVTTALLVIAIIVAG